jgi:ketosteroid isomerase-like protein
LSVNKKAALEFYEAQRVEDFDRLRAILTPDMVWWLPASTQEAIGAPDALRGADQVIEFNKKLLGGMYKPDLNKQFVMRFLIEEDDKVAAFYTLKTVTPSGKPYENEYAAVSIIKDGKVAEHWTYVDTAHAFKSLLPDPL